MIGQVQDLEAVDTVYGPSSFQLKDEIISNFFLNVGPSTVCKEGLDLGYAKKPVRRRHARTRSQIEETRRQLPFDYLDRFEDCKT